jgi:hypothetical protein
VERHHFKTILYNAALRKIASLEACNNRTVTDENLLYSLKKGMSEHTNDFIDNGDISKTVRCLQNRETRKAIDIISRYFKNSLNESEVQLIAHRTFREIYDRLQL